MKPELKEAHIISGYKWVSQLLADSDVHKLKTSSGGRSESDVGDTKIILAVPGSLFLMAVVDFCGPPILQLKILV